MPAIHTIKLEGLTLTKPIQLNKIPKQGNVFHTDAFEDLTSTFNIAKCKWEYPLRLIYDKVQLNPNNGNYECELKPVLSEAMEKRFIDFAREPRFTLLLIDCLTNETEDEELPDNGWKFDKAAYTAFVQKHHLEDFTDEDVTACMFGKGFIAS